jgi:uncharacterized damage-inducible protein DinB
VNASLAYYFNKLEAQRENLLHRVASVSADDWNRAPKPGKWSIGQILTHLLTAEQLSIGYMKKKSLGIDQLRSSGPIESLKLFLLKISQRVPLRYRAPEVVVQHTPEAFSRVELTEKWEKTRSDLKQLLEKISDKDERKLIYRHPVAGRLNAGQAMIFFQEHIIHHWPQINRLLNKS